MTNVAMPDTIGLQLPPQWTEVGVDADSFDQRWREIRAEFREGANWNRTAERRLELFMYQLRRLIEENRVVFSASLFAAEEPDGSEGADSGEGAGDPDPLMAGCVISVMSRDELGADVPLRADTILMAYTTDRPDGVDENESLRFANLDPPSLTTLRSGDKAVRLARLATADAGPGERSELFMHSFLVPIAKGEALCALQFTTPNVGEAKPFSELFDAIGSTLRLFYEDTPTIDPEG